MFIIFDPDSIRMKVARHTILLALSWGFIWSSCKTDPDFPPTDLIGRWEVLDAERDGNKTKSLNKGYFEFYDNERLFTNILNSKDTITYMLEGNTLNLLDQEYSFNVVQLQNDSLILNTRIKKTNFKIRFIRTSPE